MNLRYDPPILLLQHAVWHEGYHHGQMKLAHRLAGYPITDEDVQPHVGHPDAQEVVSLCSAHFALPAPGTAAQHIASEQADQCSCLLLIIESMLYVQRTLKPPLDAYVESIWLSRNGPRPRALERILPIGRAQLIVNLAKTKRACIKAPPAVCLVKCHRAAFSAG
jgi:hypothetical protein